MQTRWTGLVLIGLAGALLAASCGSGYDACTRGPEQCPPCEGGELCAPPPPVPAANEDYFIDSLLVWFGKQAEAPACEKYGLEQKLLAWADLRDNPSCPPCRCNSVLCTSAIRYKPHDHPCSSVLDPRGADLLVRSTQPFPTDRECWPTRGLPQEAQSVDYVSLDDDLYCPDADDVFEPDATWNTFARACYIPEGRIHTCKEVAGTCFDPRPLQEGFQVCMERSEKDTSAACPAAFPEKHVMFRELSGCGECSCRVADGARCSVDLSMYSDTSCQDLIASFPAKFSVPDPGACGDLPAPQGIGSAKVNIVVGDAQCMPRERAPDDPSKRHPDRPTVICCKPREA